MSDDNEVRILRQEVETLYQIVSLSRLLLSVEALMARVEAENESLYTRALM